MPSSTKEKKGGKCAMRTYWSKMSDLNGSPSPQTTCAPITPHPGYNFSGC